MNSEISEIDKSNFKCFKFDDESVYFGEISYVDHLNNLVTDINKISNEEIKKLKKVRHGVGVQLFGVSETSCISKYEGEWYKDKKHGKGKCLFSDNSTYEGSFINDNFEGHGTFIWPNSDMYIGDWSCGRMDGKGEFRHYDGHILNNGIFKNNYFFDKERFINPFLSIEDLELFKEKNTEYIKKKKSLNEKFSRSNIYKIISYSDLVSRIDESIKNNKTPVILRTNNNLVSKNEIYSSLRSEYREIDLRHFHIKMRENPKVYEVINELQKIVQEAMINGLYLILNFDDCCVKYEELFDPELKEFYGNMLLSDVMWTPNIFFQHKTWFNHLKKREDIKLHYNFKFIVYSKFVIENGLEEHDEINAIEKRFEKCFPMKNINVLILSFNK